MRTFFASFAGAKACMGRRPQQRSSFRRGGCEIGVSDFWSIYKAPRSAKADLVIADYGFA
jgi:hypothetical protein